MAETFGGLYVALVLFLLVVAILWIIMPFAIFGTKPLLRELIEQQRRTNQLLGELQVQQKDLSSPAQQRINPQGSAPTISASAHAAYVRSADPNT